MKFDRSDYTKVDTYLQLLRNEWFATRKALSDAQIKKDKLNYYIYFLVEHKDLTHKTDTEIGEMLGLTRSRINFIHKQIKRNLNRKGGDLHE